MRSRAWLIAALALGAGAGSLTLAAAGEEPQAGAPQAHQAQQPDCRRGATPTRAYGERPPESFLRYRTRPIVIGCAALASGRRFELVGYQLGRGTHTSLCIDDYDFATGISSGCGSNLVSDGGAIDAGSTTRSARQPSIVAAGTVSRSVARVLVRWELGGRLRSRLATVVMVRDRALLRAIAVRKPFGRYLAEVPRGARAVTADARNARGRRLGLAFFEGFRGPIGEGRACYRRPRIASLRLLGKARAGRGSWVRVVARYPGGNIHAIDVSVSGRRYSHADIVGAPSPREAGRRVVRMPVRFRRRGTVGVDVTAEGRPLGRRCGKNPSLRRSAPRTLAVRVP